MLSDRHPAPPSLTRWLTENQLEIEISAYLYLLNAIAQRWVPIAITHQKDCLSHRLQFDGLFNVSRATKDVSFYCCPVISLCCNKLIPALHGIIRAVQHDITKLNHSIRTIFGNSLHTGKSYQADDGFRSCVNHIMRLIGMTFKKSVSCLNDVNHLFADNNSYVA